MREGIGDLLGQLGQRLAGHQDSDGDEVAGAGVEVADRGQICRDHAAQDGRELRITLPDCLVHRVGGVDVLTCKAGDLSHP